MSDSKTPNIEALGESETAEKRKPPTQSEELLEICRDLELFHNDDVAFATIPVSGHLETHPIHRKAFRTWLAMMFYKRNGKPPSVQTLQDVLGVLDGRARFDGQRKDVFSRVARFNRKVYLDLCNNQCQVIEISKDGWNILNQSPVKFVRSQGSLPLPQPKICTDLTILRQFINVLSDDDWALVTCWLSFSLGGLGPYPILPLSGEQGSAKSTTASVLKKIIDPHKCLLRSMPRSEQDLMIAAMNSWIVSMDNISNIQPWMSDAICRLATGAASAGRTLFTDMDETILEARRPVIMNGIEELATRSDLVDRCIVIELPIIPENNRRPEDVFWRDFEKAHPSILGALLHNVVRALNYIDSVSLEKYPRMADFAKWLVATEKGLGLKSNSILNAYFENRANANKDVLEASPIFVAVLKIAENGWSGTASELLSAIKLRVPPESIERKDFPKTAQALSGAIKRIAPNLRKVGIEYTTFKTSGKNSKKVITLGKVAVSSDASYALDAKTNSLGSSSQHCVASVDELPDRSTEDIAERAAIIEFDGNVPRDQAEALAAESHFFKSNKPAMKVAQPNERKEHEKQ